MHKILATTWILGIAIAIGFGLFSLYNIGHPLDALGADLRVLLPVQGGTGISTTSPTGVGKCLKVLSDSPFKYELASCGGLGSDPTIIQVDGTPQSVGTPTLNFTSNSFAVTENPADTFSLRVSTSTLGLLASSISDFVSTVRSSITEGITGLTFTTGNLTLDSGYTIPTTTRAINWDTAFSWGNHASQGYITDGNTNWDNIYGLITATNATSAITHGTTTNLSVVSSLNLFGGGAKTTANDLCIQLTGSAALCDGSDAIGGAGSSISTSTTPVIGNLSYWTGATTLGTVATGTLTANATGLEFDATRGVVGGNATLSLTSGYTIPSTTRAVAWDNKGNGTVTSVDMSVPTGLTITGNPISTSGTLALTLTTGYTIPSTTRMTNADTAFSWGNHASQGYITDGNTNWDNSYGYVTQGQTVGTTTAGVAGEMPYWTGIRTLGSVATGTLTENITGLNLSATRGLIGGSSILQIDAGYSLASTSDFARINTAFASSTAINATTPLTYTGTTGNISIQVGTGAQNGYIASTDWTSFNQKVSSTSIDTLAELETLQGSINIIASTEINSSTLLAGLLSDETGTGNAVFSGSPTFTGGATFSGIRATASSTLAYASSTALTVSGSTYLGSLSGLLKGTAGLIGTASNGTDYTLITGTTCSGSDKVSAISASGAVTCTSDVSGGGSGSISTSTIPTAGKLTYWTSASQLSDVATGTLTESVTGLELDATRGLVGGSAVLGLTSGYTIPTTTRADNWDTAFGWGNHALAGYGNVSKVSTPADNQVGVWTGDGTIEGDTGFTFDGGLNVTVADAENKVGLTITQNDTTNNQSALIVNDNTDLGTAVSINKTDNGGYGPDIYTNHISASPANWDQVAGISNKGNDSASNNIVWTEILSYASNVVSTTKESAYYLNTWLANSKAVRLIVGVVNGILVGSGSASGVVSSNGNQDLILQTGNATTGNITIVDGANGNVQVNPNGTGRLVTSASTLGFASSTALTVSGNTVLASASSTNLFATLGTFTNLVVNTLATFLNVTITGLLDLGAGVLEIPNGTAPVIDSIGEMGLDSTDDQLIMADGGGTARVFGTDEFRVVSLTMASSSLQFDSGDLLPVMGFKDGLEITQFRCYVVGGTSKVVNLTDGTNDTETITCATTMTSDTDVATNDTFTADEIGSLEMGATTGTVNYLHFEAWARITRE